MIVDAAGKTWNVLHPRATKRLSALALLRGATRQDHRSGPQQTSIQRIAGANDREHVFLLHVLARLMRNGFVLMRIEWLARRIDFLEPVARQRGLELRQHHLDSAHK